MNSELKGYKRNRKQPVRNESVKRADRKIKRKFHSNRFTMEKETEFASTSAAKLARTQNEEILIKQSHRYRIIEFVVFNTFAIFNL